MLQGSLDGRALLAAGKRTEGLLKEAQRKEVGRLIIRYILSKDPAERIQSVTFTRLALQVASIFPKEAVSLYFTPSLSSTKYQKKKNASGILYEAYISRRRKLRELGELPRGTSRSSSASSTRAPSPIPSTSRAQDNTTELEGKCCLVSLYRARQYTPNGTIFYVLLFQKLFGLKLVHLKQILVSEKVVFFGKL